MSIRPTAVIAAAAAALAATLTARLGGQRIPPAAGHALVSELDISNAAARRQ